MTRVPFAKPGLVLDGVHYGGFDAPFDIAAGFAVVDVETTGLSAAAGARIVEIAIHLTSGDGTITDSLVSLVDPGNGDTGAEHIHGITPAMVSGAPTWRDLWPDVQAMLAGRVFVAHNASFDASFMAQESLRVGATYDTMPGLCSYWLAQQALPEIERHNLEAVTNHLGLVNRQAHAAEGDTRVVVEALPTLLARVERVGHYVPATTPLTRPQGITHKER